MKNALLSFLLLMFCTSLYAQEGQSGRFDFEAGFEVPLLASAQSGKTNAIIPFIYLEGRWQLEKHPIDIGFHLGVSVIQRKFDGGHENYRAVPIMFVGDYQFGRGTKFNPYVGMGIGVSANTIVNHAGGDDLNFAISPRAGIRLFKFMNVALGYHLTQKDYSRLYCNLGFYF